MTAEQWQQHYDFPKPGPYDPVIMQCRTNRRAAWAAQLAKDAGLQNCLVYKQVSSSISMCFSLAELCTNTWITPTATCFSAEHYLCVNACALVHVLLLGQRHRS